MNDMKEMQCMKTCKIKIMLDYAHEYEDVRCPKHGNTIEHSKTFDTTTKRKGSTG